MSQSPNIACHENGQLIAPPMFSSQSPRTPRSAPIFTQAAAPRSETSSWPSTLNRSSTEIVALASPLKRSPPACQKSSSMSAFARDQAEKAPVKRAFARDISVVVGGQHGVGEGDPERGRRGPDLEVAGLPVELIVAVELERRADLRYVRVQAHADVARGLIRGHLDRYVVQLKWHRDQRRGVELGVGVLEGPAFELDLAVEVDPGDRLDVAAGAPVMAGGVVVKRHVLKDDPGDDRARKSGVEAL